MAPKAPEEFFGCSCFTSSATATAAAAVMVLCVYMMVQAADWPYALLECCGGGVLGGSTYMAGWLAGWLVACMHMMTYDCIDWWEALTVMACTIAYMKVGNANRCMT
jgi:hypothetical protein